MVQFCPVPRGAVVACHDNRDILSASGFHHRRGALVVPCDVVRVDVVPDLAYIDPHQVVLTALYGVQYRVTVALDCSFWLE